VSTLTIRNLDEGVKRRLRARAAEEGRSMEEEARIALQRHVGGAVEGNLYDALRSAFEPVIGVELEPFPAEARRTRRSLPDIFEE
jgi:plasmid stability protein